MHVFMYTKPHTDHLYTVQCCILYYGSLKHLSTWKKICLLCPFMKSKYAHTIRTQRAHVICAPHVCMRQNPLRQKKKKTIIFEYIYSTSMYSYCITVFLWHLIAVRADMRAVCVCVFVREYICVLNSHWYEAHYRWRHLVNPQKQTLFCSLFFVLFCARAHWFRYSLVFLRMFDMLTELHSMCVVCVVYSYAYRYRYRYFFIQYLIQIKTQHMCYECKLALRFFVLAFQYKMAV